MKRKYHVVKVGSKGADKTIRTFCQSTSQMLLPLVDLITEARLAVSRTSQKEAFGETLPQGPVSGLKPPPKPACFAVSQNCVSYRHLWQSKRRRFNAAWT